ncbi:amino acid/amide ABC transporter substrate-binding protein, HAAT family (TC 3.A.1.4.-) [Methylobacterium sp. ap11]|uniref:ABC transporter substrate-binding protein n=1 Tax=Methylobacterium sp. ap11 TaxID=1761799 RepID=UPI0008C5D47F|nr:ABC transporter substrate-binding protein [Methylobacterium sp. ap11]SEP28549.1 amino acid/amide ABC transporter substrate-binding protein, HAAT family (TC 3.A.1.4.-) [Methylobacterium sp. ap11]
MRTTVNLALLLGLLAAPAAAQTEKPIRIGVLSDLGGAFADVSGPGSILAAKMAAEDYRAQHPGRPVEVISGDHQNKADIGSTIARRWTDTEGVDLIIDVPNSAVALAVSEIVKTRNRTFLVTGGVSSALTGTQCSPNTVHYSLDTWTMANVPTQTLVAQGGKTWYYVTADYAFGHDMQRQSTKALEKSGGRVFGSVNYPSSTMDYSSFLLQAQASNADVIALAAANGDFVNAMKQAVEFNLMGGKQKVVGLAVYISDIIFLTSRVAKGAVVTNNWYWDLNDQTRAFSARFAKRFNGKVPTDLQAGAYAAVTNFLAAADEVGASSDGRAVVAKMKSRPNHDPLYGESTIRQDGRRTTPVYVWTVKDPTPGKSYDLFEPLRTVPMSEAYRPLTDGGCPLVTAAN